MQPVDDNTRGIFHDSLERCTLHGAFLDTFYRRFLAASDEVAAAFAGIDMHHQARMLKVALYMILTASTGNQAALKQLDGFRDKHRSLPPHLYDLWLETLVETVAEIDPRFDADVEAAWRAVMGQGIKHIKDAT